MITRTPFGQPVEILKLHPCDVVDISKPISLVRRYDDGSFVDLNAKGVKVTYNVGMCGVAHITEFVRQDELYSWLETNVEWASGSRQERKIHAKGLSE